MRSFAVLSVAVLVGAGCGGHDSGQPSTLPATATTPSTHARRPLSGQDITLNLGNEAVSLVGIGPQVPPSVRARVEQVISVMRAHDLARR